MKLEDASQLIKGAFESTTSPEVWADLGSGTGLFTRAMAHLLPPESTLFAIDRRKRDLDQIPNFIGGAIIATQRKNFIKDPLPINLDGILMANSLHYVRKKEVFIEKLKRSLKTSGKLLIIEYDTQRANPWVPFPIQYSKLNALLQQHGFQSVEKIGTYQSLYGNGEMYAALGSF